MKNFKKYFSFFLTLLLLMIFPISSNASEKKNEIIFGNSGSIYEAEYDSEKGNTTKWITVNPGENGIRIINESNQDIIMVDKFGGIYVNGTIYVNGKKMLEPSQKAFDPQNGFIYLLIIINLFFNFYNFFIKQNRKK